MILYHATPSTNLESILGKGLLLRFATGKARRVWLHARAKRSWARKHVSKRHQTAETSIIVLRVLVPDAWVTRFSDGVYWVDRDIPPAHIESVTFSREAYRGPVG